MDFWYYVALHSDYQNTLKLQSVCIFLNNLLSDENFWKEKFYLDFIDIHKKDNEPWRQYYRRRTINYGRPMMLSITEAVKGCRIGHIKIREHALGHNILYKLAMAGPYDKAIQWNYVCEDRMQILTIDHNICVCETGHSIRNYLIKHHKPIRKIYYIYRDTTSYFIDQENILYMFSTDNQPYFLQYDVIDAFNHGRMNNYTFFYTTSHTAWGVNCVNGTYRHVKLLDEQVLDIIIDDYTIYYINMENKLITQNPSRDFPQKYQYLSDIKFKQLCLFRTSMFFALGIDGFIYKFHKGVISKIEGVKNVKSHGSGRFLTEDGDLYYYDENIKVYLVDTDIIYMDKATGCYIKRCL